MSFQSIEDKADCQENKSNCDSEFVMAAQEVLRRAKFCRNQLRDSAELLKFTRLFPMTESPVPVNAHVEVVFSDRPRRTVSINELPFLIGRGTETGNHLSLDDLRISRKCAAICDGPGGLLIEDRGQLNGIFVNGELVRQRILADGDRIRLGIDDGVRT